jgi:hypothetical protein
MCLTQGLTLSCSLKSTAGVKDKIYLVPVEWLDDPAFTVGVSGDLSALAIDLVASGGVTGAYEYDLKRDANGYSGEFAGESPNLYVEQTVTLVIPKMQQEHRNIIMEWTKCYCGLVGIVCDRNGKQWVLGVSYNEDTATFDYRGLRVAAGTAENTGIDPTADQNEYTITLSSTVFELAREYTGAIPTA